jgi:membrane-bound metal-dependent hydrolase YbcI (DUF457 family)
VERAIRHRLTVPVVLFAIVIGFAWAVVARFSLFNIWETFAGQAIALFLVVGSYLLAQYLRVWRPRRRGQPSANIAVRPPEAAPVSSLAG